MKLNKHQMEIVEKINSGKIYDIYSYLQSFDLLYNYKIEKKEIETKFNRSEEGKQYKVLKDELSPNFNLYAPYDDNDYTTKRAILDFSCLIKEIDYNSKKFSFDPCMGIDIGTLSSFDKIKEFLTIWQFLKNELLIMEVPKNCRNKDIGIFFQEKEVEKPNLLTGVLESGKLRQSQIENCFNKTFEHSYVRFASRYIDNELGLNYEMLTICSDFIEKKILVTPSLNLYIKHKFKTNEQIYSSKTLTAAYVAIIVTIVIALVHTFKHGIRKKILIMK